MPLQTSGSITLNDIATEFGGSTPHSLSEYYAGGGLVPSSTSGTYGAVPSSGAISVQNFYGTSAVIPAYIEEVFSTFLYTGTGSTQTITNGIDLAGKGGLVWVKNLIGPFNHRLVDTVRGGNNPLYSNLSDAQGSDSSINTFSSTGFNAGTNIANGDNGYVTWTFRKQPKFFDIVTYTGDGTNGRAISHSLGSIPGFVIVKRTDATGNWKTYHYLTGAVMNLNTTDPSSGAGNGYCGSVSSTTFTVYESTDTASITDVNASGGTYIAYLFAHNAGGFGATGTDNVITCGYYEGNGLNAGPSINLGYEPQWLLYKRASVGSNANWGVIDNMRGWATSPFYTAGDQVLRPNTSAVEFADDLFSITSTGFNVVGADPTNNYNGVIYIYIAIRRGPMKTPTSGTQVFNAIARTGTGVRVSITGVGFPPDLLLSSGRSPYRLYGGFGVWDRMRGINGSANRSLFTNLAGAEQTGGSADVKSFDMDGYTFGDSVGWGTTNAKDFETPQDFTYVHHSFRRAPGFFDVVCYQGTSATQTVSHNLGVTPELIINRRRANNSGVANPQWLVWRSSTSAGILNNNEGFDSSSYPSFITSVGPTSFSVNNTVGISSLQASLGADSYVTYLFASCPGVSKVGEYTGNGSSQTINMGFTGGARYFLVKRTNGTGDWWVYDSARGIVAAADPALRLNSTAAEVTSADAVGPTSVGLIVNQEATCNINVNGATYIYLGIA